MNRTLRLSKWNEILIEILKQNGRPVYCELLGRRMNGSLAYIRKIVKSLEKKKIIMIKPENQAKLLYLTDKGRKIANYLFSVQAELK